MNKKIIYFDMDGVLVDLAAKIAEYPTDVVAKFEKDDMVDQMPALFLDPPPIKGAVEAFNSFVNSDKYDVYILSTAPWENPSAWMHKRLWVEKHLGEGAWKRLILSHNKNLNIGDYLIDDRTKNGAGEFKGELVQFGSDKYPNWESVINYLQP
jgi:5'(3')-deoxyribonucleotidase